MNRESRVNKTEMVGGFEVGGRRSTCSCQQSRKGRESDVLIKTNLRYTKSTNRKKHRSIYVPEMRNSKK